MNTSHEEIEGYVFAFGAQHRELIIQSLEWLDRIEPSWNLDSPVQKIDFLSSLIERVYVEPI